MRRASLHQLMHLAVLFALIARHPALQKAAHGLVDAQRPHLFKRFSLDPDTDTDTQSQQDAIQALRALSFDDRKTRRLSKGKGAGDLNHVPPNSPFLTNDAGPGPGTGQVGSGAGSGTGSRPETTHNDDIIHEFDHADNEAYDDIVWYDGPHRDDEDEHQHEHENGDSEEEFIEEDHHHGHEDHIDLVLQMSEDGQEIQVVGQEVHHHGHEDHADFQMQVVDDHGQQMLVVSDSDAEHAPQLVMLQSDDGAGSVAGVDWNDQLTRLDPHEHGQTHDRESSGTFQHSGADKLTGTITTKEFCLRLKHECESTCREFRAKVEHISVTCEAGSVAELLFWGKCCQIGQEHRVQKDSTKLQADLVEEHVRWQQQRHQVQMQHEQEYGQRH
ncbi:hypothetical protein B0O80DRAFT_421121 [Mortierella sp. GBAus27b]|nr:hypothetical protein BGX31_003824 [Mortierella sp. GBA43]KAI8363380.1 hypothetical protein B0O80DRAFT_421121 [Mortierella sp. GBAus27b]